MLIASHADGFWQNEEDLSNGDILTEDYLPRVGFDQTRGKFGATHPQNLADGPAIVAELAANYEPPIPVRQAETTPTILAPCSVVPAEPFASPFDALSPALQSIIFEGTQESTTSKIHSSMGLVQVIAVVGRIVKAAIAEKVVVVLKAVDLPSSGVNSSKR